MDHSRIKSREPDMDLNVGKHLVVLGMNHLCSDIEIRERFFLSQSRIPAVLSCIMKLPDISEALVLSTCNRIEFYAVVTDTEKAHPNLLKFLSDYHKIETEKFEKYTYFYNCYKAAYHLYKVISSLDSLVIGEYQIVSQVKKAYRTAWENGSTGPFLNKLFHFAISAGKKVRTETGIGEGIISVASVAVDLACRELNGLDNKKALIIGAGEMSKLTARHLVNSGLRDITFINRTEKRAQEIASQFGVSYLEFSKWRDIAVSCDLIISSTGSPHRIITIKKASEIMRIRKNRPLVLIDIAMPRDIEPGVENIEGIYVFTIDHLMEIVDENSQSRKDEIVKAESIISEEVKKYYFWYNSRKVQSVLVKLREQIASIRDMELKRYSSAFSSFPEPVREEIKKFAASLTDKFLHIPSTILKERSADDDCEKFVDAITDLFNLDK